MIKLLDIVFQRFKWALVFFFLHHKYGLERFQPVLYFICCNIVVKDLILTYFYCFEVILFFDFLFGMQNVIFHIIYPLYNYSENLGGF